MVSLAQLINETEKSFAEARAANETRYADILEGYAKRREATIRVLQESQQAESSRLRSAYAEAGAGTATSAQMRGLGSVADSLQGGLAADEEFAQQQLVGAFEPAKKLAAIEQDVERLKFMEDREDQYPDAGFYANILQQVGRAKNLDSLSQSLAYGQRDIWPAHWARLNW